MRTRRWLLALGLLAFGHVWRGLDAACGYDEFGKGCDSCHDFFAGNPDLHDIHREQILLRSNPNRCQLCHTQSRGNEGAPVKTYRSRGGLPAPGPSNLGCAGCHGNDYGQTSTTDGLLKATAKGLRQHHQAVGIAVCASCHAAGDAGAILAESVLPPYYQRTDVVPKDPCNGDGNEGRFVAPVNRGLDNDGDLLYDAADPDCAVAATGACCIGTACSLETSTGCDAAGGNYLGDGVPCDASSCVGCAVQPGTVRGLQAVKQANRTDAVFTWSLEPGSASYRVYSVSARLDLAPPPRGGGPPRGSHPAATLRCSTPDGTTQTCTHPGAVPAAAGATLFYQGVGVCAGDPTVEGPN